MGVDFLSVDWILPLIGGLGLGSLLNSVVSFLMQRSAERRSRAFAEKKEAYQGLLSALHEAAVRPSDANAKQYALWSMRVSLVGSPTVARIAEVIPNASPNTLLRTTAFESLVVEMRKDLGVDLRPLNPMK
jgi:hypothetical protein